MKKHERSNFNTILQSVMFSMLLAVTYSGMAQESAVLNAELTPVEADRVNINHADAATIARVLNGVGMSRAEAIVSYREEFGDFASLEELSMVRGVGEVTLKNNESRISFD